MTGVFIGAKNRADTGCHRWRHQCRCGTFGRDFCKGAVNYMIPSHKSRELAETAIMKKLYLDPVLDADMALGEEPVQ